MPPSPLPFNSGDPGQLQFAIAALGQDLDQAFSRAEKLYARIGRMAASGALAQPPFSYDDRQIAWITRIAADMHKLAQVAYGKDVPDGPYNFMTAIGQETGFR